MSTSLAEQLQRLARPQTSALERGKKRASLLFDPKEAAGLRKETVFEIGLNGLEELISKDEIFEEFTSTLFSLPAVDFERSIQSAEENKKLDKYLRKFLVLLSPYFRLHCTFKALEWLIYRYSIHEYNREELLMLILPYHESNVFVRVIQLIKIKDHNDPWFFLKSLQKPGIHLPKQSLLNHAASDPFFIKFVSTFILEVIKVHRKHSSLTVAFNFYCAIFTGAIEYSKQLSEPLVAQMLPSLMKGLNSDIPDFRAASYVITARLVSKCTLSSIILDKFMQKISRHKVDSLKEEAILVYLVLYQSQVTYKNIPEDAIAEITEQEWFPSILQELNSGGSLIYPFLEVMIKCLVENGVKEDGTQYRKFFLNLINQLKIDEEYLPAYMNVLIDSIPLKLKKLSQVVQTWIAEVIEITEKQYPTQFDKQVYQILVAVEDKERRKKLHKILKNALTLKQKFEIFEKLYHPNALIRTKAMKFISTNFETLRGMEKDILIVSLEDRLNDENVEVVKEALSLVKNTGAIQNDKLKRILMTLLNKYYKDKVYWSRILQKIIQMLCISENSENLDVVLNIFPLLLPKTNDEIVSAKLVIQTELFSQCALFKTFNINADFINVGDFPNELFKCLKSAENKDIIICWLNHINETDYNNYTPLQRYCAALIMGNVFYENSSIDDILPFLQFLEKCFQSKSKSENIKYSILENFKVCKKGKLPVNGYLECVLNIVSKIHKLEISKIDFSSSNSISKFFLLVTSILYHDKNVYAEYVEQFNSSIFMNHISKIVFMLHLAVFKRTEGDEVSNEILCILYKEMKKPDILIKDFLDFNEEFISYILILMTSEDTAIRKKIFEICEEMLKLSDKKQNSFISLLNSLFEHQEEIILDACQLPLILADVVNRKKVIAKMLNPIVSFSCNQFTPQYIVIGILEVLSEIKSFEVFEETSKVALEILEKKLKKFNYHESMIIAKNIGRFDESLGKDLKLQHNITKFLILVLKTDNECLYLDEDIKSPSLILLDKLYSPFISSLSRELQFTVLDIIIEISTISDNPNILLASNKLFKYVELDVKQILPHLIKMKDVQSQRINDFKKKRRVSIIPNVDILDTIEWKKGIRVLELIQTKKKMSNILSLIPVLFDILKKCLDFDEQAAVEYPKQLILSLILHSCKKLQAQKIPDNIFNMELVVQCIRASTNPQTHHHALLVLGYCASLIPTQVLHHIMAIFTFMGSSVLRHDDAYSFQLITNIVDTVIPILVSDGNKGNIISVLRVFVDALLDVPEHRRIILYTQLLQKIDPEKHLHLFLLLVFVSHVLHNNREKIKTNHKFEDNSTLKRLDIAVSLTNQFSPHIVFTTCVNLIQYLRILPVEHENLDKGEFEIDLTNFTAKQFRHFKYTISMFINTLISSKEFISKVAVLEDETLESLESLYKDLIVNILSFIQKTNPIVDKYINTNQAQYWKAIQHQNLEILDGINALLTADMFLLVIKGLMTHNLSNIRKRALDLLNSKLQGNSCFTEECQVDQLYDLINPLLNIVDKLNTEQNEEEYVVIQTALLSLKLIIKHIGSSDPDKYVIVLEFITNIIKSEKAQGNVLASLILCLAELCVTLRSRAIPSLPNFMPVLLKIMKQQKYQECPTLLCLSLLAVIMKILESLSLFISPYLKKLLSEICQFTSKWDNLAEDPKLSPFIHKLTNIKQKLGEILAPRVLIPAIEDCYTELIEKNKLSAIGPLMGIFSENLTHMAGPDVTSLLPELTKFFIKALEFRSNENCDIDQTNIVENQIIDALSSLVLKLSETSFRPLYYKIFDWAVRNDIKNDKIITFYNVSCGLAKHLKSLFVLFAGNFIHNAAQVLDNCNKVKTESLYFENQEKNVLLLEKVIETLSYVFKYTTMKFINKERFEILMQPLIDQLENDVNGIENLVSRNDELLTPCIVNFAIATADDALWKQMNYQILLKMRSSNSHIRLISLKCLTEVVKKLGEDFLPLLPETIPFLSELLEDEEENVEKNCKKAIQEMEKVLGESLQKYF